MQCAPSTKQPDWRESKKKAGVNRRRCRPTERKKPRNVGGTRRPAPPEGPVRAQSPLRTRRSRSVAPPLSPTSTATFAEPCHPNPNTVHIEQHLAGARPYPLPATLCWRSGCAESFQEAPGIALCATSLILSCCESCHGKLRSAQASGRAIAAADSLAAAGGRSVGMELRHRTDMLASLPVCDVSHMCAMEAAGGVCKRQASAHEATSEMKAT